jgi:hypothetical protein
MAVFRGSRYELSNRFAADAEGRPYFKGLLPRTLTVPEAILEHPVASKDRQDSLAQNYYQEPRLWHRIVEANLQTIFAEDLLHDLQSAKDLTNESIIIPHREEQSR